MGKAVLVSPALIFLRGEGGGEFLIFDKVSSNFKMTYLATYCPCYYPLLTCSIT